jgi:predicted ATPase/DNA-binding CsgD family transcriptional regulator
VVDRPAERDISNNLPVQATTFVGRAQEIEDVKRLLATSPLLTITGSGGAGKSRLALQVAGEVLADFPDGVWLAELAPLSDPGLVLHTVAQALGVRDEPGRTVLESVVEFLRSRSLLLVLDNCEHVISASAHLADLLVRRCPSARIVVTTREPLGVAGERTYRIPPLSLPHPSPQAPCELLTRSEAVRLFVERAGATDPGFAISERNASAVAQICRRLDGIPLAIELAAARVKVLSAEQIAARLDDCFHLLTGGGRTSLPRHQTLRATIDWSHALLSDQERALLRRSSVFAGGFGLDAVEGVCTGRGVGAGEVLDLLTHLVDKSLILAEVPAGEARFGILETVRRYGREKLLESGEQTEFLTRHRDWYLALAERAEPELQGPEQKRWIRRLEAEHDNLRDALGFSLEGRSDEEALRLTAALWWFWHVRGYLSEGRTWLRKALAGSSGAGSRPRARALYGAGFLAWRQGEFAQAQAMGQESLDAAKALGDRLGMASAISLLEQVARAQGDHERAAALPEQSLALFREMGDGWGIATSLVILGNAARFHGDYARAREALEESLDLYKKLGDISGTGAALHFLGLVARDQGDYARAEEMCRESLRLNRELGDTSRVAFSLHSLGLVARDQSDHAQAEMLFRESLALFRELEDTWGVTTALVSLGVTARLRGDDARAAELLQESLRLRRDLGDKAGIAECLEGLAAVAAERLDPRRAARLLGAGEALRASIGAQFPPVHQADCERAAAGARKRLGRTAFEAARAAGRTMDAGTAIEEALALALPATPSESGPPEHAAGPVSMGSLTQREGEVAALIAQGRTNKEIARTLVITEGTAANHVQHILNKLGLNSRAQIAAWAVAHRLGTDRR